MFQISRRILLFVSLCAVLQIVCMKPSLPVEAEEAVLFTANALDSDIISNEIEKVPAVGNSLEPAVESEPLVNPFSVYDNKIDNNLKISETEYTQRVAYGKKMLTFMNQSVDPCDDFYEYACGNFENVMDEHDTKNKRNYLLDIFYKHLDIVEELLETPLENYKPEYRQQLEKAKLHYQSCLQADLVPFKASEEYLNVIKQIGGFPALDEQWNASEFSWFNMSSHLTNYGAEGFINEKIFPIYPFPPYFKLPTLGFEIILHNDTIHSNESRAYFLNEQRMKDYLRAYGVSEDKAKMVIDEIFEFWKAILNVSQQFKEDEDACQVFGINKTHKSFEEWNNHLEIAWQGIDFNTTVDDCPCDYFYLKLDEICEQHKSAAANYLALKFLFKMDANLNQTKFQKEYCVKNILETYRYLIDKIYMQKYFNDHEKNEMTEIIKNVREILRELLEQADWLDEETRKEALEKESLIGSRIGKYEDEIVTEAIIESLNDLTFSVGNYAKNNMQLQLMKRRIKRFNGMHRHLINNETKPLELLLGLQVNSFYYNIDNSIYIMAGVLHPPVYHKSWPKVLKYGTLGFLIGHELTHGFDTTGSNYDSRGEERYWWSEQSGNIFTNRSDCYINHYNQYYIPEINRSTNGNITKDENIADAGGLREALRAYKKHIERENKYSENKSLELERMPGLEMTSEQILFLGFSQMWCSAYKEEHYWEEITNDHPIDKYRVIGTLSTMEEFSKAFNCPLGSKMNPKKDRCDLW